MSIPVRGAREGSGPAHTWPSRTCPKTTHRARQRVTKTLVCQQALGSPGSPEPVVSCPQAPHLGSNVLTMLVTSISPVTASHLRSGQIRETASEHGHVTWLTSRKMASHSLPLERLPLRGRKSSPGYPTKCSHCSQLPTESNPAQHSDWASPHKCLLLERASNILCSTYEAASSMKTGPGGTLRKGVKCQTGLGLKIQHQPHSPVPSKPRA